MLIRLAWRSIWRHRRRTLITVSSIGLGLAFAFFSISLGEGLYSKTTNEVAHLQSGHITLERPEYREAPAVDLWVDHSGELRRKIEALPQVERTKGLVLGQGVARTGRGAVGVAVMGVEPSIERATSPLVDYVTQGEYLRDGDTASVLIGSKLAKRLHLRVRMKLVLTASNARGELVEELCRVRGIFTTGSDEADGYLLQAPIDFCRKVFGIPEDCVTQVGVLLKNPRTKRSALARIRDMVKGRTVVVRPWEEIVPELASYIRLDRGSNWVFQGLLLFLILFTIFNTILMSVLEREREFAVLVALGTRPRQLQAQVLLESAFIAAFGCAAGLLLGGLASYFASVHGIDLRSLYKEGVTVSGYAISLILRPEVTAGTFLWLGGMVFVATLLLSLLPAQRIARISLVESLR